MTPTLIGRFQTRLFLILVVGVPWTLLISPLLPVPATVHLPTVYRVTYSALGLVAAIGLLWDAIYYGLQQLRWDKDWPSLFSLLNGLNEGVSTWIALHIFGTLGGTLAPSNPMFGAFVLHFSTTWILIWLAMQGPMRILFLRWRFQGGRVI
jgi:hypothetical protein